MHYIHRFKSRTIERIVGLFILLSVIGLISILFFTLHSQKVLEKKYQIKATFSQGYGLKIGAKVYLSGFEVGMVESIQFDQENKVQTVLLIQKSLQEKIRQDSIATMGNMGMFGDRNVSISIGSKNFPVLLDGEEIKSKDPAEITDLTSEIEPIIKKIETTVENIKDFTSDLNAKAVPLLDSLEDINTDFNQGKGPLGVALKDEKMAAEIKETVSLGKNTMVSLEESANEIKETSKELSGLILKGNKIMDTACEDIPQIMNSGKESMKNIEEISNNLKEGSESLPDIVGEAEEGIGQAKEVIEAVKKNWLIKRHLPKEEEEESITIQKRDGQY